MRYLIEILGFIVLLGVGYAGCTLIASNLRDFNKWRQDSK